MKIFSVAQIKKWDDYTIFNEPISSIHLMERAASACFTWLQTYFKINQCYTIFCGTGNNGADGLAIARMLLLAGKSVKVYILESENKVENLSVNLEKIQSISNYIEYIHDINASAIEIEGVIIDALLGSGLNRPLNGRIAQLVQFINQSENTIISIDIPTGLLADEASTGDAIIRADHTISFQSYKLAFVMSENNEFIGRVHILDIGLHPHFYDETAPFFTLIDQTEISLIYKPRKQVSHKYNFGHALLYAGSKNMMGAALLCAKACLRSGAGLVTLHTEEMSQSIVQIALPEAITSTENNIAVLSLKKAAIGIGPGLEISSVNKELLINLLDTLTIPQVIDATALHLLSSETSILSKPFKIPIILTPHSGEFEKLFGKTSNDFEKTELARKKSIELNCYIILKGHHSLVACLDGTAYINSTGNAGMATAGSGDVLTGILTGLLAQGYSPKNACLLGVYLHGLAGDIAAKKISQESMIASDIIDSIGEAFISIQNSSNK
jgi:ADP-dependent NAD(P)H-hydrate dehydratase / NAD(P)H-hydrate epimerase